MWVSSASGLTWSMNWDSWLEPKNSLIVATTGLMEIRSWGRMVSASFRDMRSLAMRSMRVKATFRWLVSSSPTERMRRLPRWSMSSTFFSPMYTWIRKIMVLKMSSGMRVWVFWASG